MKSPNFQDKIDEILAPYRQACLALKLLKWEIERAAGPGSAAIAQEGK
jgi:hypothetical protein